MNQIDGLDLGANFNQSLGAAGTPEEAAQIFMRAASQGLAKVLRDAIVEAVGTASGGVGGAPWTTFVKGVVVDMDWGTPEGRAVQTLTAFATPSQGLGGVDVSVGVHVSF